MPCLDLELLPGVLAVCRLDPDSPEAVLTRVPRGFLALVRTAEELSVVCEAAAADPSWRCETGWRALRVTGTLDFALTGVLASLAVPLAGAGVSIFAVSTFDTDYVLVRESALDAACRALAGAGHRLKK